MTYHVAVVGSGPAGVYITEALAKGDAGKPLCKVDLFDRLPTPYGLVRSGVAPDHQGTKNVWRVFQRTLKRAEVRFVGNVELGRDVSLEELRAHYDAVVLAVGAPVDRELGVPGQELKGVLGSGPFTSWYNGHPDHSADAPPIEGAKAIAVIGNGNVAVDVVRVLGRAREEMLKTDLPAYAADHIEKAELTDIYMIGRRGPAEASFTPVELRELGEMQDTVALVNPADLPEYVHATDPKDQKLKEKILEILRGYSQNDPSSKKRRLHIMFCAAPAEVRGSNGKVESLVLDRTKVVNGKAMMTGEQVTLQVGAVVTAIGFFARPIEGVTMHAKSSCYPNHEGKVDAGLWAVGWSKRGPSGVVATNRQDSIDVATRLQAELPNAEPKDAPSAKIDALLASRGVRVVSFADWEKIEKVEHAQAQNGAARAKVTDWKTLLELAFAESTEG
jgi:ferredoxin--NADP+ reductase